MAHSPDRVWWWNGTTWVPAYSPDRAWWWDGARWISTAPAAPVRYAYQPTPWTRRLQRLLLALMVLGALASLVTLPLVFTQMLPQAMHQSLANQPQMTPAEEARFQQLMNSVLYGSLAFAGVMTIAVYAVQLVGIWKLWRWVYWYFVVVGLVGILSLPQDLLYALGVGPYRLPPLLLIPGAVFSLAWFALAVCMIVLYRRYGTWARRRVEVPADAPAGHSP